jgi:hypothetical protein
MVAQTQAALHFAQLGDYKVLGDAIFCRGRNMTRVPNAAESSTRNMSEVLTIQWGSWILRALLPGEEQVPVLCMPSQAQDGHCTLHAFVQLLLPPQY